MVKIPGVAYAIFLWVNSPTHLHWLCQVKLRQSIFLWGAFPLAMCGWNSGGWNLTGGVVLNSHLKNSLTFHLPKEKEIKNAEVPNIKNAKIRDFEKNEDFV